MYTCVVTYPLGCVIEESQKGTEVIFTEVNAGGGGAEAGLQVGDLIRATTAVTIPPRANLVNEPVGALFTTNPMNPNLFEMTMDAVSSNAIANGIVAWQSTASCLFFLLHSPLLSQCPFQVGLGKQFWYSRER